MTTITGTDFGGLAYQVVMGADVAQLQQDQGIILPESYGEIVQCTRGIAGLLRAADGQDVPLTPTGPMVPLSPADVHSVALWLQLNTTVDSIEGDLPMATGSAVDAVPDAIY